MSDVQLLGGWDPQVENHYSIASWVRASWVYRGDANKVLFVSFITSNHSKTAIMVVIGTVNLT